MLNRLVVFLALAAFPACAPTLHLRRSLPPLVNPSQVVQVEPTVRSDLGRQAGTAVMATVLVGRVDVPVDVTNLLRDELARELPTVGVQVCLAEPCPQAPSQLNASIVESMVGPRVDNRGRTDLRAQLTVRFELLGRDGKRYADRTYGDAATGGLLEAERLMPQVARSVVRQFKRLFLPREYVVNIPLEDGGPLEPGVNKLLAGNPDGARADLEALVQAQPNLAGAWYDLGVCGEVQGDWALAVRGYRGAAERERKDLYQEALEKAERELRNAPTGAPAGPLP